MEQGKDVRDNVPSIAPSKNKPSEFWEKAARGRWTITQAKAGISPFAGGVQTVSFRRD